MEENLPGYSPDYWILRKAWKAARTVHFQPVCGVHNLVVCQMFIQELARLFLNHANPIINKPRGGRARVTHLFVPTK